MLRSRFIGLGSYVPPRRVLNDDLEELLEISGRSIERRTGIRQRYWNADPALGTSDLAHQASLEALESAGLEASDLDLILFATLSPDAAAPGSGCFLQRSLGVPGIPTLDIRQQCSGFLYGLSVADLYIRSGQYERVLLVGAECQSKLLDMTPRGRNVTCLFGDGAGAVILGPTEIRDASPQAGERCLYSTHLHSDGGRLDHLLWQHPGSMNERFLMPSLLGELESHPQMRGRELFDICLELMPEVSREALEAGGCTAQDVDLFVIHQTNARLNLEYAALMGVPEERVFSTIQDFGNTTAATIPIGLREAQRAGRLKPGDLVLSCSFGSGLSWASALYRW